MVHLWVDTEADPKTTDRSERQVRSQSFHSSIILHIPNKIPNKTLDPNKTHAHTTRMTKSTPPTDPTVINPILEALIDREASYPAIARAVGLTLDELFELLENPNMQAKIQRMQRLLDQRAALLTAANEAEALGALGASIESARGDEAKRADLVVEHRRAVRAGSTDLIAMLDDSLGELEGRFKRRTELTRTARAILVQARAARRPGAKAATGSGRFSVADRADNAAPTGQGSESRPLTAAA